MELKTQINRMKILMGINETLDIDNNHQLYFHGGNLDNLETFETKSKIGSIVYGVGLYLTTSRTVAEKYAKGNRKLYVLKVKDDINTFDNVDISKEVVKNVFTKYLSKVKYKNLLNYLERINPLDVINASNLNNYLLNENLINKNNITHISDFFRYQGVDGSIDYSPFGYGEKQLVLMDLSKIVDVQKINRNDSNFYDDFIYKKR